MTAALTPRSSTRSMSVAGRPSAVSAIPAGTPVAAMTVSGQSHFELGRGTTTAATPKRVTAATACGRTLLRDCFARDCAVRRGCPWQTYRPRSTGRALPDRTVTRQREDRTIEEAPCRPEGRLNRP